MHKKSLNLSNFKTCTHTCTKRKIEKKTDTERKKKQNKRKKFAVRVID